MVRSCNYRSTRALNFEETSTGVLKSEVSTAASGNLFFTASGNLSAMRLVGTVVLQRETKANEGRAI